MSNKNKYFTSSFYLAALLFAKGLDLAQIEKTDPRRAKFVFINSPELEQLVELFNFGKDCPVDARRYSFAIKSLKGKLYD